MLARFRRRSASLPFGEDEHCATWQCASLLLGYPSDELLAQLPLLESVAAQLPSAAGEPLLRVIRGLAQAERSGELARVRSDFVDTFDYTRRCAPYLTYFAHGDTRKRGLALVQFKQAYRHAGYEINDAELPDHLSVVLEFGATCDLPTALKLVLDHRAGLEVLRIALLDKRSPWADVLVAVCATLPALDGDDETAVARLLEQGPPEEAVGLNPYGGDPHAMDPRLHPDVNPPVTDPITSLEGIRS